MAKPNTTTMLLTFLVIGLLAVAGFAVWGFTKQEALGSSQDNEQGGYISTGATTITVVGSDALSTGTAVSGITKVQVNGIGAYSTDDFTLSASPKDKLNVLIQNSTTYHNALISAFEVPSAPTGVLGANLKKNATVTMTVFNTNGDVMDASGALINQTAATGGSYNMKIRIDGQDKASTNDMVCILESSDGTKADKMTLSGFGAVYKGMSKPSSYTLIGSTSAIWVYELPAIEGAVSPEGVIGITSKTGQDLSTTQFKITCKTKEHKLDSITGLPIYDIEDSAGTAVSMATYSFTDYFD